MADGVRAGLDDPRRIEAARRLLAEAPGEALDRLAALSARLLGAAHAQIAIRTDEQVTVTPLAPRARADALVRAHAGRRRAARDRGAGASSASRSRRTARSSACCASTTTSRSRGPSTTSTCCASSPARSPPSSSAARWARARDEHGPARPRLRGGGHRQLRLGPAHGRAALGRAADGAVRLHAPDVRRAHRLLPSAPASRRPIARGGRDRARRRALRRLRGRVPRRAPRRRPCAGSPRAAACCATPRARPVRMLGAAYDTTEVHSAAERLGRVLETMSTAFITLDREWTLHATSTPPPSGSSAAAATSWSASRSARIVLSGAPAGARHRAAR